MSRIKSLRTIKIILPSILAVGLFFLVSMSSAFQRGEKIKLTDDTPMLWELSDPGNSDVTDPESYIPFLGDDPECPGGAEICVIEAPSRNTSLTPDFSEVEHLEADLIEFSQTGNPSNASGAVQYKP